MKRNFFSKLSGCTGAVSAAAVLVFALAVPEDAFAVAGFARQTGMNCNSCHTLHGAPTPNFTFTGKKFNAIGYRLPKGINSVMGDSQEQGKPEDLGEFFRLLPTTFSARFQYQLANTTEPPGADEFGPVVTNPTSRLAFFPFTGPIGKHWGIWTEFYIVPFTSEDGEWGIADTSYEEFDIRYIINPDNESTTFGFSLSNQDIYGLFGFSPFPGLPSGIGRGGVGGYSHPNRAQLYHYGWIDDRWVYAIGAETGDTNYDWSRNNWLGFFGYALRNRNDDELWLNIAYRTGNDALPLVTASGAERSSRSWQYRDAVGGISDTRRAPGDPCPGLDGRRATGSCAYLAEEVDNHDSLDVEVRWGAQNVDKFFGKRGAGDWSFEMVGRLSWNDEDYIDGAGAERRSWGFQPMIGYKHTWYFKPLIQGDFDFEFRDMNGLTHDIDTSTRWSLAVVFKPVENYLIYAQYGNNESIALNRGVLTGKTFTITADVSF